VMGKSQPRYEHRGSSLLPTGPRCPPAHPQLSLP
jgi:hypothetical protein